MDFLSTCLDQGRPVHPLAAWNAGLYEDMALNLGQTTEGESLGELAASGRLYVDGAALGVFLLGLDPLHSRGLVRLRSNLVDPALEPGKIVWTLHTDNAVSGEEFALWAGSLRVVTLHAHSKESQLFDPAGEGLRGRIELALSGKEWAYTYRPSAIAHVAGSYWRLSLGAVMSKLARNRSMR